MMTAQLSRVDAQPARFTRRRECGLLNIGRHWPGASERGPLEMITNGKVKIACLIGVVGLVAFWFTKLAAPKPAPIALVVRSYTNACAVIVVTNLGDFKVEYILKVERKINDW